jgi:hypothetical protein
MDCVKAMKGLLKPSGASVSHPSKGARIEKIKQVIGA